VVEVGLGGRLDATRLCRAHITVVTAIGVDHVAELGTDLEGQAREKGAIMRDSVPAILGPGTGEVRGVLEEQAAECGAVIVPAEERVRVTGHRTGGWGMEGSAEWLGPAAGVAERDDEPLTFEWDIPLTGDHMVDNLMTALAAVSCLSEAGIPVPADAVTRGVREVRWPGRLQYMEGPPGSPGLLLDVAHNPLAAGAVAGELTSRSTGGPVHMVLAQAVDKDLEGFLEPFIGVCSRLVATAWQGPRARDPAEIAECAARLADARGIRLETVTAAEPVAAVSAAAGGLGEEGLILATGSHMLVGPLLAALAEGGPGALLMANDVVPRSDGDV
jgi:dihydrofolate synthase/folylpolyglutamate synthase